MLPPQLNPVKIFYINQIVACINTILRTNPKTSHLISRRVLTDPFRGQGVKFPTQPADECTVGVQFEIEASSSANLSQT